MRLFFSIFLALPSLVHASTCSDLLSNIYTVTRIAEPGSSNFEFKVRVDKGSESFVYKATEKIGLEKESLELGDLVTRGSNSSLISVEVPEALTEVPDYLLQAGFFLEPGNDLILRSRYIPHTFETHTYYPEKERAFHLAAEEIYTWVKKNKPTFRGQPVIAEITTDLIHFEPGPFETQNPIRLWDQEDLYYLKWTFKAGEHFFSLYHPPGGLRLQNIHFDGERYIVFDPW